MAGLQTRVLLLATSKSGKSVKLMELVRHGLKHGYRFLVGDHMCQWSRADWPRDRVEIMRTQNLEKLCQVACATSPRIVVFDEIDLAINSRKPVPETSAIYEVLHMGRNPRPPGADEVRWPHVHPVGLWGAARRPGSLRPDLKDTLDRVYIGRTRGKRNLEWIADTADLDMSDAEKFKGFQPGQWVYYDLQ